ncbi:MAG: hypothetical protein KBT12_03255 [Bacteroidales bacterium]|nr:hypothetical protein [Candidatus Physcousia equi]
MKKRYSTPTVAGCRLLANKELCINLSPGTGNNPPLVADTREESEMTNTTEKDIWESEW